MVETMSVDLGCAVQTLSAGTLGCCKGQTYEKAEEEDNASHYAS